MRTFRKIGVSWCKKSNVGDQYPFNVKFISEYAETLENVPIFEVSEEEYDEIAETLNDFKREYPQYFVITDGRRFLAIDTEGYPYPRYKSPVSYENKILPF